MLSKLVSEMLKNNLKEVQITVTYDVTFYLIIRTEDSLWIVLYGLVALVPTLSFLMLHHF